MEPETPASRHTLTCNAKNQRLEYNALVRTKDTSNGGAADGIFYTDLLGVEVKNAGDLNVVKQFIKPGAKLAGPNGGFHSEDAWRGLYVDDNDAGVPRLELDNAFGSLN